MFQGRNIILNLVNGQPSPNVAQNNGLQATVNQPTLIIGAQQRLNQTTLAAGNHGNVLHVIPVQIQRTSVVQNLAILGNPSGVGVNRYGIIPNAGLSGTTAVVPNGSTLQTVHSNQIQHSQVVLNKKSTKRKTRQKENLPYGAKVIYTKDGNRRRRRIITLEQRKMKNILERDRMLNLNKAFEQLRGRIPTLPNEKKPSRIDILRLAAKYIQFMTDLVLQKADLSKLNVEDLSKLMAKDSKLDEEDDISMVTENNESVCDSPPNSPDFNTEELSKLLGSNEGCSESVYTGSSMPNIPSFNTEDFSKFMDSSDYYSESSCDSSPSTPYINPAELLKIMETSDNSPESFCSSAPASPTNTISSSDSDGYSTESLSDVTADPPSVPECFTDFLLSPDVENTNISGSDDSYNPSFDDIFEILGLES